MDFFNNRDDPFPVPLLARLAPFFPLVVAGPADTHKSAKFFDVVFPGQGIDYFVFFRFKGMYTCSPFSIFTVYFFLSLSFSIRSFRISLL